MILVRASVALVFLGFAAACASGGPSYRALHVVDGEEVYSRPVAGYAYEAYLRARLALEEEPPRLPEAQAFIETALQYDPRDPHLWTTQAEIAARSGNAGQSLVRSRSRASAQPRLSAGRRRGGAHRRPRRAAGRHALIADRKADPTAGGGPSATAQRSAAKYSTRQYQGVPARNSAFRARCRPGAAAPR